MRFDVLVVDDDLDTRANLQDILEMDGYAVETVGTAAAALARTDWPRFGAIILDRRLPDATAEEILPRFRELAPDAAVLVVTGYADVHGAIAAFRLGAADYVLKPIDPDDLRTRLGRIAEQRQTREALREREEELGAVLDALPVGVWFTDQGGRILYGNPTAQRIWGGARFVGPEGYGVYRGWWAGTGRPVQPHEWAVVRAVRGETVLDELVEIETFGGGRKVILNSAVPLRATDGTVRGAVVINQDVTERERALAALREKTEELRATTQQLWQAARLAGVGELAASIAHELNNPLATVSLRVEGLLAKTPSDDTRRKALEIVDQEVDRMGRLVANLLNFSRAGREEVSTVNVPEEVTKTIELTDHHFRRRGVAVAPEFGRRVPEIQADRQQLRQVLLNLFTNAADAMPRGGRLIPRVQTGELAAGSPAVVIEVADTGTGIPPDLLPRVTEPFFTTKEEGKGTGLGLAICRRIVEQHHGRLEVESELGKGTTVRVLLPVHNETNTNGPPVRV